MCQSESREYLPPTYVRDRDLGMEPSTSSGRLGPRNRGWMTSYSQVEMCEVDRVFRLTCNKHKPRRKSYKDIESEFKRKGHPYFTRNEIVVHNTSEDCWVSFLGVVRDLTPLVQEYAGLPESRPIVSFAGKDISDWFDPRTGDILHHVHPVTGVRVPWLPHGPLPDTRPLVPTTEWTPLPRVPWWYDHSFVVGYVTANARPIRIKNVLTNQEVTIEVCSEDTLERILERYSMFNCHAVSYTWKYETKVLDMDLTLDQNKIPDPRSRFRAVNLPDDTFIPCLMLYYNDDLT